MSHESNYTRRCWFCQGKGETDYFDDEVKECIHCEGEGECSFKCDKCEAGDAGEEADRRYDAQEAKQ